MGVPGFFSWLLKNKNKLGSKNIINENINKVKYLMLDTNCLLHPCVNNIIQKYKSKELLLNEKESIRDQLEEHIWKKIEDYILDIVNRVNPENLLIAIDGVAPMGKILQQRQRRYKYLYDSKIKLHSNHDIKCIKLENGIELPEIPISSIELTPGTDYMERIHIKMEEFVKKLSKKVNTIYSSYHEEGEGEHKILQYIKNNVDIKPSDVIAIYGLDADLLFLSLGVGYNHNLYIMREVQIFNNKEVNLDDEIDYNYVEIKQLHNLIKNLGISTNDFIILCYLIGNDFIPGLLTIDVKKGGLDKIFTAYDNLLNKLKINRFDESKNIKSNLVLKENNKNNIDINSNNYIINDVLLIELFKEILWTERYIWKNINRENHNKNTYNKNNGENFNIDNRDNLNNIEEIKIQQVKREEEKISNMNKFKLGISHNTNFLEKIEFNSDIEYYSYYLGIECINIDKLIIIKMVKDYITTIQWCINYYLNDCKSWAWGYNLMIAPLIKDIIYFYPKKIEIIEKKRELNPVEQLILAIPPYTYKYVIEKTIIENLQNEKNIGYMFPESFDIDINKELIYWKCQVKIPMVEYDEYIKAIKNINIVNPKNLIIKN
jgi:5'-3' exonuclease